MPSVFGLLTHAITDNCMNINLHSSEYNAGAHHDNAMSRVFIKLSLTRKRKTTVSKTPQFVGVHCVLVHVRCHQAEHD